MLRAMYSGIGGMRSFQTKLDVIGNNIANVNTTGFKKGRVTFQDLVSQQISGAATPTENRGGINPTQVGLGSTIASIDTIQTQGSLQTTGRNLDMGITGDGFFIANNGGQSYYTRAGNFYIDEVGNLVTADGLRIQGYQAEDGVLDTTVLGSLQITSGQLMPPTATTEVQFKGNLDARVEQSDTPLQGNTLTMDQIMNDSTTIVPYPIIDSLGNVHQLELVFRKTGENQWQVGRITPNPNNDQYTFNALGDPAHRLRLDNNGSFLGVGAVGAPIDQLSNFVTLENYAHGNGAAVSNIQLDLSRMSQFARNTNVGLHSVNGNEDGTLESYSISQTGELNGVFSNGEVRLLGQIALATFNNPGGLSKAGSNLYQISNNSGEPQIGGAGGDGRGMLTGGSLEMSNVDLSEEFTELIVAQRGFQANTRIITTSDEILQELVNLKR
ncbi:flagellar hook protein FlgE [Evansella sp. AB-rgal1]|uniref:flagellar hook protein FlgE n=1 Tax=Evansella sp. AB-rgal1 TaxID=3242696 RepID=UPI00359CF8BC